jgi:hypothetical protein
MPTLCCRALLAVFAVTFANPLLGQSLVIPVRNWTVSADSHPAAGLSPMTDLSPGVGFVAMAPCRLVDTRGGAPFTGAYGPPALAAHIARDFDLNSAPNCPGIPAGVDAYSLNLGAILPPSDGFLTAWPTGSAMPTVSAVNYLAGEVIANAAIVSAGTAGSISVYSNVTTHVYVDINGYFTDQYNAGVPFRVVGNVPPAPSGSGAIIAINTSTTTSAYATGGLFEVDSCGFGAAGVNAFNASVGMEQGCGPVLGV